MKHLTTLLLASLISGSLWADDEFPIELTCEFGVENIFFYLNKTKADSWYMFDKFTTGYGGYKPSLGEKNPIKRKYEIKEHRIELYIGKSTFNEMPFFINRYTLGITRGLTETRTGQCYKGFKEYEKQI